MTDTESFRVDYETPKADAVEQRLAVDIDDETRPRHQPPRHHR